MRACFDANFEVNPSEEGIIPSHAIPNLFRLKLSYRRRVGCGGLGPEKHDRWSGCEKVQNGNCLDKIDAEQPPFPVFPVGSSLTNPQDLLHECRWPAGKGSLPISQRSRQASFPTSPTDLHGCGRGQVSEVRVDFTLLMPPSHLTLAKTKSWF